MADKVRFTMDRMAALFRQLQDLEIFAEAEIKSIVKRRTDFEYLIKRRQLEIADYYGYLQYELNLEKLRDVRCIKITQTKQGPSRDKQNLISSVQAVCMRHICSVYERAIRRFPAHLEFWQEYIAFLKEKKASSVLNTVLGRAIFLHPKVESLWIQAAVHELEVNSNASAARIIFQRALRTNNTNKNLWTKYFEFELWNGARICERQRALSLDVDESVLVGAPLVVVKHALAAIQDVKFACSLHTLAKEVANPLADAIELMLKSAHPTDEVMWLYFVSSTASSLHHHHNNNNSRKRKQRAAADIISSATGVAAQALGVVQAAQSHVNTAHFCVQAADVLVSSLLLNLEELTVESFSVLSKFQRLGKLSLPAVTEPSSDLEHVTVSREHSTELSRCVPALHGLMAQIDNLMTSTLDKEPSGSIVLESVRVAARHRLWLLGAALSPLHVFAQSQPALAAASLVDVTQLAQWLSAARNSLGGSARLTVTPLVADNIQAWSRLARLALSTCNSVSEMDDTSSFALVSGICSAIFESSDLICATSEGQAVLTRALTVYLTANEQIDDNEVCECANVIMTVHERVIGSLSCLANTRGSWCERYLQFRTSCSVPRVPSTPVLQDEDDSDDEEPLTLSGQPMSTVPKILQEVFELLECVMNRNPALLVGASLSDYYHTLVEMTLCSEEAGSVLKSIHDQHIVAANKSSAQSNSFLRVVLKKAISACPESTYLLEVLEELERKQGNLQAANHIKWTTTASKT